LAAGVAVIAASAVLTACGGGHKPSAAPSATPSVTPSATPPPAPRPISNASPLTGRPNGMGKPVLVVKIDNTRPAHPQTGVDKADVVYLEQVEAGLTRLAAVFSSQLPPTVGPVRSARETDIDLFAMYGRVAFAYSGAQRAVRTALAKANLYLAVDGFGGGWFRGSGHAPYNLFAEPSRMLKARPKAALVHDIGFRFGKLGAMHPSKGVDVSFKMASVRWRWSSVKHAWVLSMDGSPANAVGSGQLSADNVIVQFVKITASRLHDINGNHTPYTSTVGKGTAFYFRDGRFIAGAWSRTGKKAATTWTIGRTQRYQMKPGRTWIILVGSTRFAHVL
jgi:hypothetical protein